MLFRSASPLSETDQTTETKTGAVGGGGGEMRGAAFSFSRALIYPSGPLSKQGIVSGIH